MNDTNTPSSTGLPDPATTLPALLDLLPSGVLYLRPVVDAAGALTDFTFAYLNPAAQRLLGLPKQPTLSYLQQVAGRPEQDLFAWCCQAFQASEPAHQLLRYEVGGQAGTRTALLFTGRRLAEGLLVSCQPDAEQRRSAAEEALPASQQREQDARAQAEADRTQAEADRAALLRVFEQAPLALAILEGPARVVTLANAEMGRLWGRPVELVVGRPHFETLPELRGQGFEELLTHLAETGEAHHQREVSIWLDQAGSGQPAQGYFNVSYQPLRDGQGATTGVVAAAVDVTEQVRARHQLQLLNGELAALNEELQASNAEYLQANAALSEAQQLLRQLNHELETRVQQRSQQLAEVQRLHQQILDQMPAAVATFHGPAHQFTYVNAPYQAIVEGRAAVGRPLAEALPEAVAQGFVALLDEVYATGRPYRATDVEAVFYDPGAAQPRQHFLDLIYQPLTSEGGQVHGVLAFVTDVTVRVRERRQADTLQAELLAATQRQVQEREDLYQVFAQTPAAVLLLRGPAHRVEYVNAAVGKLFPGRQLLGRSIAEGQPESAAQGFVALLDEVYQTGETFLGNEVPLTVLDAQGQPTPPVYLNFSYQAFREQGQVVGISVFGTDVTEQVLARQQREEQARQFRELYEQAPAAICILRGPEFIVELANPAILAIWGLTAEESLGHSRLALLPEASRAGHRAVLETPYRTRQTHHVQELPLVLDRAQSGQPELGYFNFIYQPLLDAQGEAVALTCVGIEVTEQVRARQQVQALNEELAAAGQAMQAANHELLDSNDRLKRANADLDTFVYTASHDLKSPITNIEGLLRALREQLPVAALQAELIPTLLDLLDGSVRRFQQTLDQLTDITRLQRIMQDQPTEAVDLPALAEAVRLDILPELTAAGATLTVDLAACPMVYFPAKILRSVLYNLLSNAVKYRAPDRPPHVQLRGRRTASGQVVLSVQDNGLGLSEQQQQGLFQLFRRLHAHVPGSGVGLYTVKRMVENAGGTLTVQSQVGEGSTFTLTFPG